METFEDNKTYEKYAALGIKMMKHVNKFAAEQGGYTARNEVLMKISREK